MLRILPLLSLAALAPLATAQNSWLVGPNGIADLQTAIDGATAGDEIVIEPGTYAPFFLDRGLTFRAQQPGTVYIPAASLVLPYVSLGGVGRAQFHDIHFEEMFSVNSSVTFEDCTFAWTGTVVTLHQSTAHFERCSISGLPTFIGGFGPLYIGGSYCSMVDCVVEGTTPGQWQVNSPAVDLQADGVLIASRCTFRAGAGPTNYPAIQSFSGSVARISDSIFDNSASVCSISGPADVVLSRCTVPQTCSNQVTGTLLGALASGPIERGATWAIDFTGEPNEPVLIFGSDALEASEPVTLEQPFLLGAAGCFAAGATMLDANGVATWDVPIPNVTLPPGVAVFCQGVSGFSFPLRASNVVGGVVR